MTTNIGIYEINTSQNDLVQKLYFCGPRKPINNGAMNEMIPPFRNRVEIMGPGLRPSTLPLGYGGYP